MTVRAASAADVPAVLALWAEARTAHAVSADTPEALEALLAFAPGSVLVVDAPGGASAPAVALSGAVIAAWDGWRGTMYRLAVRSPARRQGVGLALVRAGEERLRALGARRISVLVAFDDEPARGLWAAAGYEADAVIGRMVRDL